MIVSFFKTKSNHLKRRQIENEVLLFLSFVTFNERFFFASKSILSSSTSSGKIPLDLCLIPVIPDQNNLISYGRFCGAGPDREIFHKFQPIDSFDTACRQHDADYDICYNVLQEEVGKNVEIPSLINQIMALRGWIPFLGSVKSQVFGRYSNYLRCMHHADRQLIHSIQEKLAHHQYPSWWNDLSKASFDLVGKHSYSEACSFGIPSTGYCLVTVKDFFHLVITFFQASVDSDLPYLS